MKPLHWIGNSLKNTRDFPEEVRQEVGFSIQLAQKGGKAANAVPLVGFGSAKVLEVIIDDCGDTFRAIYTVKFRRAIYVLHAFKKKSKKGRETPRPEVNLIKSRLELAEAHYKANYLKDEKKDRAR
jgi:phage-related protein